MSEIRVRPRRAAVVAPAVLDELRALSTSLVSDALGRDQGAVGLLPIHHDLDAVVVGRALTVRTRPGDNLAIHCALDFLEPGDVLVVDGRGGTTSALVGELIATYAHIRGAAAIVVDGLVRDVSALRRGPIPVFARGVCHQGPYKSGPGSISSTCVIGGVAVDDGDLVVGDADGIVVIPVADVAPVLEKAHASAAAEAEQLELITSGNWPRPWLPPLGVP